MSSMLCALICSTLLIAHADADPEGLAFVKIDGKFGFIDTKSNFAINPQFDYAESFAEGLAFVEINGKWGVIDTKGNIVIEPQFDYAGPFQPIH